MRRVKFYSPNDLSRGYNLELASKILDKLEEGKILDDVNEIIELYNIKKYLELELYLPTWDEQIIIDYQNKLKYITTNVMKYFSKINNNNFRDIFKKVDNNYISDFFQLLEKTKAFNNIDKENIENILSNNELHISYILNFKFIVKKYGETIKNFLLNNKNSAELLLDKFEVKHFLSKYEYHFPEELTSEDKEQIILNYIEYEFANLNYIRLIINVQNNKDKLIISSKTKLKAIKKSKELENRIIDDGLTFTEYKFNISFSENQSEEFRTSFKNNTFYMSYSLNWLTNNLDFPTLLNNFIFLFEFADLQMRWKLINVPDKRNIFDNLLYMRAENDYIIGNNFETRDTMSNIQLISYKHFLSKNNIRLEELFEWFFNEYIFNEFNIENFNITLPTKDSTMLEKCRNIAPEIESVLKQFQLYVENSEIDLELLTIQSEQIDYSKVKSLIKNKYVYGNSEIYNELTYLLFSEQCMLSYIPKKDHKYHGFLELLLKEKIKLNDYNNKYNVELNILLDNKLIKINENNQIEIDNKTKIAILSDIYKNGVLCYWNYPEVFRNEIDKMINEEIIYFESTLFAKPEYEYINYFFNKAQFNNGLDLRNKYSHGNPHIDKDNNYEMFNNDYIYFLKILILIIIKINDEFCIYDTLKENLEN